VQYFPYLIGFPKSYQNRTTESGSKLRFSLFQEKVVIQEVCLQRTQAVQVQGGVKLTPRPQQE